MKAVENYTYDIWNYISDEKLWLTIGQSVMKILLILLLAFLAIRIGKVVINRVFFLRKKGPLRISERREATLVKLLENVLTYATYFITLVMILEAMNIKVTAILAGAGIVGLAIGFGAQNLVRDIITGFFIIFEDQFSVGDYVRIGQFEGFVEEIGLRTTKVKSFTNELHILPNGNITEVTNFSIYNSIAIIDVGIAYEEDIPQAEKVLQELLLELPNMYEDMIKAPELLGVQSLGASDVVFRIISETVPMKHWSVARSIRREVKLRLDERGIEIPFPRLVMYSRHEGQTGKTQVEA
ncbi:mechanosensitive ion channel family protein [Bacillus sp. HMF5848]|uniref:mechanosensitive ion channel family protein n=1 Tax=Bacillus sp. HMF5848 TaxID=2495421 RepID=UPI000F7ADCB7|nr:mechanosensitive ion channel family protein [Bacillus sp. HMF5848]RSK29183.1 mechanosensitive ion channel family protein [Bacillus sp. HMF5848]